VTKASGEGLRIPFGDVIVAQDRLVSWPGPQPPETVSLRDLEAEAGYVAALAVIGPCGAVLARDGSVLLERSDV
jgi:hypothetical protein